MRVTLRARLTLSGTVIVSDPKKMRMRRSELSIKANAEKMSLKVLDSVAGHEQQMAQARAVATGRA